MDEGYGNFELGNPFGDLLELDDPEYNDLVSDMQASHCIVNIGGSSSLNDMLREIGLPADSELSPPETPSTDVPKKKRFKSVTEENVKKYEAMNQSNSTKKNTKWGMKILQDWHNETYGSNMDMLEITVEELSNKLGRFYCEVKPQDDKRTVNISSSNMTPTQSAEYHRNTLKNITAAVNRHLSDIGRNIDIVNDREFKHPNKVLNGLLKERMTLGTSRRTQHKNIITQPDLNKISTYIETADSNPIKLRLSVWYIISIHFVTRGLEFHHQLLKNSFQFEHDENGIEYACLNHETKQKNYQGGLSSEEDIPDKRMYATGSRSCPVKMLKLFLSKTDSSAQRLFNHCVKEAIHSPELHNIWYTNESLGITTFNNFLPDICKQAACSKRYTAHCTRAAAIQMLRDSGFETRQIMYMSGHRNEASVRSYSRDCSSTQKQSISSLLPKMSCPCL